MNKNGNLSIKKSKKTKKTISKNKSKKRLTKKKTNDNKKKIKYVIGFDFDKTLMKYHWWNIYQNTPISEIRKARLSDFGYKRINKLFKYIISLGNVGIAIASFGRRDVIIKVMSDILGEDFVKQNIYITTPRDFGQNDGTSLGNKNRQIEKIKKHFNVNYEDIIYFDDDRKNIQAALTIGVNAHYVKPFKEKHIKKISKHLFRKGRLIL